MAVEINSLLECRKKAAKWLAAAACFLCFFAPASASVTASEDSSAAAAICPVVYPLDETPSEKGYHYLFYGNAFFVNEDGYLITAAHILNSFRDGGQPHVLVELPSGQRHLLKADVVATDWEHDVAILRATPNPFRGANGSLSEAAERGKKIFASEKSACATCHSGPDFTDGLVHDVGLGSPRDRYQGFNTPSLRGVYQKVKLLHDGRADSLREVLTGPHAPESVAGSVWPALIAIKLCVVVNVVPETVYTVAMA